MKPKPVDAYMDQPSIREPGHTCPEIDEVIRQMEKLREANDQLRTWGRAMEKIAEKYYDSAAEWESWATELEERLEAARAEK